jgi:hypothetical protein
VGSNPTPSASHALPQRMRHLRVKDKAALVHAAIQRQSARQLEFLEDDDDRLFAGVAQEEAGVRLDARASDPTRVAQFVARQHASSRPRSRCVVKAERPQKVPASIVWQQNPLRRAHHRERSMPISTFGPRFAAPGPCEEGFDHQAACSKLAYNLAVLLNFWADWHLRLHIVQ